jgi:hypothetical protein
MAIGHHGVVVHQLHVASLVIELEHVQIHHLQVVVTHAKVSIKKYVIHHVHVILAIMSIRLFINVIHVHWFEIYFYLNAPCVVLITDMNV